MKIEKKTIENDEKFLRQKSQPVSFKNKDYIKTIELLKTYCETEDNLLAIASVQIGIPLRLIYLKKTKLDRLDEKDYNESRVLINPKIIKREGLTMYWEACASCLTNFGLVERPYKIEVEYYDIEKNIHHEVFIGFESTVLSHEFDHLEGILHIDKSIKLLQMGPDERKEYRTKHPYRIIRKTGEYEKLLRRKK